MTAVPHGALLFTSIVSRSCILRHLCASAQVFRSLHWRNLRPSLLFDPSPVRPATWRPIQKTPLGTRLPRNPSHDRCLCCWRHGNQLRRHHLSLELRPNNLLFRRLGRPVHRLRPTASVLYSNDGRDQNLPLPIPEAQNTHHPLHADVRLGHRLLRTHLFCSALFPIHEE